MSTCRTTRGRLGRAWNADKPARSTIIKASGLSTPHDPDRQTANRLRARNWLNEAIVTAALLKLPPGGLRRIAFQPNGSLELTLNGASFRVWDWRYEQVLDWSQSLNNMARVLRCRTPIMLIRRFSTPTTNHC